jgi:uncharacterized repeat protein (TIGR01451 family)
MLAFGVVLLALGLTPMFTPTAAAVPPAALTPTAEPPTRTSTPQATATPLATDTPVPTSTPQPTREAKPEPADPAVTKAASVAEARIGDIVDFTLTVTNHGGETADDVVVTDALPNFLDVVEATTDKGTLTLDGRTVVVTIGEVHPGEVVTIRIRTRVNEQAQPPGGRNSVGLTTSNNSDDPLNNVSEVILAILGPEGATATPITAPELPSATPLAALPASAATPPKHLPITGAADDAAPNAWPLAALGLAIIGLSLLLHRRTGPISVGDNE